VIGPSQSPLPDNTVFTREKHPCLRRDSNLHFRQASDLRPTPCTARPTGSAMRLLPQSNGSCGRLVWLLETRYWPRNSSLPVLLVLIVTAVVTLLTTITSFYLTVLPEMHTLRVFVRCEYLSFPCDLGGRPPTPPHILTGTAAPLSISFFFFFFFFNLVIEVPHLSPQTVPKILSHTLTLNNHMIQSPP